MTNQDIKILSLLATKHTMTFILDKKKKNCRGSEIFTHNALTSYGYDGILDYDYIFTFDRYIMSNLSIVVKGFHTISITELYEYVHIGSDIAIINGYIVDHVDTKQLEDVIELLNNKIIGIQNLQTLEITEDTMIDNYGKIIDQLTKEEDAKVLNYLHLHKQTGLSTLIDKSKVPKVDIRDIVANNVKQIQNRRILHDSKYLAENIPVQVDTNKSILQSSLQIPHLLNKIEQNVTKKQQDTSFCEIPGVYVHENRFDLNRNHRIYPYPSDRDMTEPIMYFEDEGTEPSDPFMDDEFAGNRLVKEWQDHGKLIIAYDFDNTIFDYYNKGYKYDKVINLLKRCKKIGAYFIVSTCCDSSKMDDIKGFLTKNDIPFDSINENAPFIPFQERKIYYNVLLDDRAGLRSAYIQLSHACDVMESAKEPNDL